MFDESGEEKQPWTYKEPIGITKEQWMAILEDEDVVKEKDIELLKLMYACDGCMATGGQLARLLNIPYHGPINFQVWHLAKRIVKTLNIQVPKQRYGEGFNWWHVPFWGMGTNEGFYWILRPELRDAMRDLYFADEVHIPEEIDENVDKNLFEGAKTQIFVNSYERNRAAREDCIKHYGTKCVICGFNFEEKYGEVGKNVIHVHHLKPLHEIGETYTVDPIEDLRPVCPNCHVIIHRRNPPYSVDEIKDMIESERVE